MCPTRNFVMVVFLGFFCNSCLETLEYLCKLGLLVRVKYSFLASAEFYRNACSYEKIIARPKGNQTCAYSQLYHLISVNTVTYIIIRYNFSVLALLKLTFQLSLCCCSIFRQFDQLKSKVFKDVVDKFTLSSSRTWSQEGRRESRTDNQRQENNI